MDREDYLIGSYAHTPLKTRANVEAVRDALRELGERNRAGAEAVGDLRAAIGLLDFNEAENEYRENLLDEVNSTIAKDIEFGSYAGALTNAKVLAKDIIARPGVRDRIKANTDYKNFVNEITHRNDLNDDDKAWALEQNPYYYEDVKDAYGRVIGGSKWQPKVRPLGEIPYNDILSRIKSLVFETTGSSRDVVFTDANGKPTTNPELGAFGVMYYKDNQWRGIDKNKLDKLLEAAIDNTPGARARLRQDYEVANWKYNKDLQEGKTNESDRSTLYPDIFAPNGKKLSYTEWYNNKFGKAIESMAGMNYSSSITYDDDYSKYMASMRSGFGQGSPTYTKDVFAHGTPVILEDNDVVNKSLGKIVTSGEEFEKVMPYLKQINGWNIAKQSNDFNKMADIVASAAANTKDPAKRQSLMTKVRDLRENVSVYNSVIGKPNVDKEAILFNAALSTGGDIPANNQYSSFITNVINKFGGEKATKLQYRFESEKEANEWAENIGLKVGDYDVININGISAINLDKSDIHNYKGLVVYDNNGYENNHSLLKLASLMSGPFASITGALIPSDITVVPVNDDGEIISGADNKTPIKTNITELFRGDRDLLKRVNTMANRALKNSTLSIGESASNKAIATTIWTPLTSVLAADKLYPSPDDISKKNTYIESEKEKVWSAITNTSGSQTHVMLFNEDTNTIGGTEIKNRTEALDFINSWGSKHKQQLLDNLGLRYVGDKAYYSIKVPLQWSNKNNSYVKTPSDNVPFREVLIHNDLDKNIKDLEDESGFRASAEYDKLARIRNSKKYTFDNHEIIFGDYGPVVDGELTSRETALGLMDRNNSYTRIKDYRRLGIDISQALKEFVLNYYNYDNASSYNDKYQELLNQIENEIKY